MSACPQCKHDAADGPMGSLGMFDWYRCRACGWEWPVEITDEEAEAEVQAAAEAQAEIKAEIEYARRWSGE